ncbi:MAG: hypothetical protein ABIK12_16995 [Pseudomonadota bacterium]
MVASTSNTAGNQRPTRLVARTARRKLQIDETAAQAAKVRRRELVFPQVVVIAPAK